MDDILRYLGIFFGIVALAILLLSSRQFKAYTQACDLARQNSMRKPRMPASLRLRRGAAMVFVAMAFACYAYRYYML